MLRIVLLLLTLFVLSTNCAGPGIVPEPRIPPSLVQRSRAVAQGLSDGHLTADVELDHAVLKDNLVLEIWFVRPELIRLETLESNQLSYKGLISASNGDEGWTFNDTTRQVEVGPIEAVKPALVYDAVHSALDLMLTAYPDEMDALSLDYVSGVRAIKLTTGQEPDACTLRIEQGSLLPVSVQCEDERLGRYTVSIREAEYDIGLTDELFDLTFLPTRDFTIRRIE